MKFSAAQRKGETMLGSVSAEFALAMLFLCFVAWRAERAWERAQLRCDAAAVAKCALRACDLIMRAELGAAARAALASVATKNE